MIRIPYEQLIEKIKSESSLTEAEIEARIKEKLDQLSGLISKEGAAHIIANQLGIRVLEQTSGKLQIKNILSGMRDVEVTGKVMQVYETREFKTEKREGKVGSFVLADETGSIRVVLWNDTADKLKSISEGSVARIQGGYVRERNNGIEIHMNDRGKISIEQGEKVNVKSIEKKISELKEGEEAEIFGTIVQAFGINFFEVCPGCGKRTKQANNGFACEKHGAIEPDYSYVLNAFLDDGTDSIRAVFFRNQLQQLLNKTKEQILAFKDSPELFEQEKHLFLGSTIKVAGRTINNAGFGRTELIAQRVNTSPDIEKEKKVIEEEISSLKK